MNAYVLNFLLFVIGIIFGLLIFTVMLRLILQIVRADFYNPISQFLMRMTNPLLLPLRRLIPGLFGVDMAAVVLLLILETLHILLTDFLLGIEFHGPLPFLSQLLGTTLKDIAQLFFFSILISVILSWVSPQASYQPIGQLLHQITEPLLRPARRIIPPLNGIDLSPILVIIVLGAIIMLVAAPLINVPRQVF